MGWDAHALKNNRSITHKDAALISVSKQAAARVKQKAGSVDADLAHGSLDCSECAAILTATTGMPEVANFHAKANWNNSNKFDPGLFESAKEFLTICKNEKLGIRFSW